jgi:IMP dehydrogenase/GMP reductase
MFSETYNKNMQVFNSDVFLSTENVLLKPKTGVLRSRRDAITNRKPILYSSPMDTVTDLNFAKALIAIGEAPVFCRFFNGEQKTLALEQLHAKPNFWFSVGANLEDFNALALWSTRQTKKIKINISVDVAHGDTVHLHKLYKMYECASWCNKLMSGTVATAESARNVHNAGCTHIRVGIGPGSACTTRIVTACGVPNLNAVFNVYSEFEQDRISNTCTVPTIIADGGIKTTGDIIKYLSAGADAVMIGNLFSDCIESAGWKTNYIKKYINKLTLNVFFKTFSYKRYRGQASAEFQNKYRGKISGTPEGVTGPIKYPTNNIYDFVNEVHSALSSALSYLGLANTNQLNPKNVTFLRVSTESHKESTPHLLR